MAAGRVSTLGRVDVLHDLFPVIVTTPEGTRSQARLVITDDHRAFLFTARGRMVSLAAQTTWSTLAIDEWPARMATDDGRWTIALGSGCGCGNPLKNQAGADLIALHAPVAQ